MIVAPPRAGGPTLVTGGIAVSDWQPGPLGPGRIVDTVEIFAERGWVYARLTTYVELEFGTTVPRTFVVADDVQLARLLAAVGAVAQA